MILLARSKLFTSVQYCIAIIVWAACIVSPIQWSWCNSCLFSSSRSIIQSLPRWPWKCHSKHIRHENQIFSLVCWMDAITDLSLFLSLSLSFSLLVSSSISLFLYLLIHMKASHVCFASKRLSSKCTKHVLSSQGLRTCMCVCSFDTCKWSYEPIIESSEDFEILKHFFVLKASHYMRAYVLFCSLNRFSDETILYQV